MRFTLLDRQLTEEGLYETIFSKRHLQEWPQTTYFAKNSIVFRFTKIMELSESNFSRQYLANSLKVSFCGVEIHCKKLLIFNLVWIVWVGAWIFGKYLRTTFIFLTCLDESQTSVDLGVTRRKIVRHDDGVDDGGSCGRAKIFLQKCTMI